MANFQQFQGDLTGAFNVANQWQATIAQQKATSAEMLAQVERFNQTRMEMDAARAKVGGILSAYGTDEKGKPDASAPKYVHDAYNAINKEGGLQQMSASQLNAVLTGYQTGVVASQQRLQDMQIQKAIRAEEDQRAIDEAYKKTEEERQKIATEEKKATTTSKKVEKAYDMSKPEDLAKLMADTAAEAAKPLMLRKGSKVTQEGWNIQGVIDKMSKSVGDAAREAQTAELQKQFDKDAAAQKIKDLQNRRIELEATARRLQDEKNKIDLNAPDIVTRSYGESFGGMEGSTGYDTTVEAPDLVAKQTRLNRAKEIDAQISAANREIEIANQQIAQQSKLIPTKVRISDADAKSPTYKGYITSREYQTSYETVKRSQEELLTDEFNIITNHLKATGSMPSNWNRSTFMQMKGYPAIQQVEIPGVGMYVSVNGKGEIIKNKDLQGDIGDQLKIRDATLLAQQRSLNGTELAAGSGYRFTGEIRSNDIKDVNKVRMEIGTTSTALTNVDTLLRIAEDASLVDKLVPGEITGVASSISNAIQAASRTEIGGSGAWSEQDQMRIDKIVRDPTALKNIAFRQETIASIKAYKQRLTDSLNRSGAVYGFRLSGTPNDARMAEARISRMRIAYQTALASGKNEQEALLVARQALEMSQ